jgi:hypothetical protein
MPAASMDPEAIKIVLFVFIGGLLLLLRFAYSLEDHCPGRRMVGDELIVIGWGLGVCRLLSFMVEFDKTDCFRAYNPFFRPGSPSSPRICKAHVLIRIMIAY